MIIIVLRKRLYYDDSDTVIFWYDISFILSNNLIQSYWNLNIDFIEMKLANILSSISNFSFYLYSNFILSVTFFHCEKKDEYSISCN